MTLAPAFLHDNPMNLAFAYSEATGEISQGNAAGCINFARHIDDLRRNYRPSIMNTASVAMSSFCHFIGDVISISSKKQMRRPNTSRRITIMQNTKTWRNWPVCENPRDSMGEFNFTVEPYLPISSALSASDPDPALIGFIYFLPESFHGKKYNIGRDR